ncbi:hypothetical protein EYF80_009566 [Liparis tanakae]|uniref:Uncharacterized protein n=1 Tax=Liparis tanakae TaxID=230148 RepID=A0A4Z2IQZ2_9TELE|nr:hypothetical protein EYF80_009566 [Liparis tanakae]
MQSRLAALRPLLLRNTGRQRAGGLLRKFRRVGKHQFEQQLQVSDLPSQTGADDPRPVKPSTTATEPQSSRVRKTTSHENWNNGSICWPAKVFISSNGEEEGKQISHSSDYLHMTSSHCSDQHGLPALRPMDIDIGAGIQQVLHDLAPWARRCITLSKWPFLEAQIRGVVPYCKENKKICNYRQKNRDV